jgi:predicted ATP-dependent serine protease
MVPVGTRAADQFKTSARAKSAWELASSDQRTAFLKPYDIRIAPQSLILLHGSPGSGKTSMSLKIANAYTPSAFVSLEQRHGAALGEQLRRLEIRSRELTVFTPPLGIDDIFGACDANNLVVIDSVSVSSFTTSDLRSMAERVIVVGILQSTKDGSFRGSQSWLHEADVCIECDSMRWRVSKSRYEEIGKGGDV